MLDSMFQAYDVLLPFTVSALTGQCRTLSTSWSQIYKSVSTFTAVLMLIGKLSELAQCHGNIIQVYVHYTTVDCCMLTVASKLWRNCGFMGQCQWWAGLAGTETFDLLWGGGGAEWCQCWTQCGKAEGVNPFGHWPLSPRMGKHLPPLFRQKPTPVPAVTSSTVGSSNLLPPVQTATSTSHLSSGPSDQMKNHGPVCHPPVYIQISCHPVRHPPVYIHISIKYHPVCHPSVYIQISIILSTTLQYT